MKKDSQLSLFGEGIKFTPSTKEFKVENFKSAGFLISDKKKPAKRKSRADGIYLPEDGRKPVTYGLRFEDKRQRIPSWALPKISTKREDVLRIINENLEIGLDFEYNPSTRRLSIVGVANKTECAACWWDKDIGHALLRAIDPFGLANERLSLRPSFVGHYVLGADKPVLEEAMGVETPLWLWEDSMITHYLCASQLSKAPGKADDGEGGLGFMNLGFAGHLWTHIHQWKTCAGLHCEAQILENFPCPSHCPRSYCAVDAWVGLEVFNNCKLFMEEKGIPWRVYEEHKELALNFCLAAEKRGIHVDLEFAHRLEKEMERKKEELFPKGNPRFNPRSNIQVVKFFEKNGVALKANDKGTIEQVLEELIYEKHGFSTIGEMGEDVEMDEVTQALYDLYLYKTMGKGTDAWVAEKYIRYD